MSSVVPKLVISPKLDNVKVDLEAVSEAMLSLGVKPKTIQSTTIFLDSRPNLTTRGAVWPKSLAWLRYPRLKARGHILRLSAYIRFSGPPVRHINHTLIHEIEHVAQVQRKDQALLIGYLTELIFLAAGIGLGLTNESDVLVFKVLILFITSLFGLQLGYALALHEIKARRASRNYKLNKKFISL